MKLSFYEVFREVLIISFCSSAGIIILIIFIFYLPCVEYRHVGKIPTLRLFGHCVDDLIKNCSVLNLSVCMYG